MILDFTFQILIIEGVWTFIKEKGAPPFKVLCSYFEFGTLVSNLVLSFETKMDLQPLGLNLHHLKEALRVSS